MDVDLSVDAFDGWRRSPCAGGVVLDDGSIRIRIRPRLGRVLHPRVVARQVLAGQPAGAIAFEPVEELLTTEGELAVVATARQGDCECSVAVAGDEPALCIDAVGEPGRARELVRSLVSAVGLALGATRRRWFRYDPPAEWFGVRRHASTVWLHPAYPRSPAIARVFDARPFCTTVVERWDRFLYLRMDDRFVAHTAPVASTFRAATGLEGRLRTVEGTRPGCAGSWVRIAAVTADDRFAYLASFEGPDHPATRTMFQQLVDSFQPVPHSADSVRALDYLT